MNSAKRHSTFSGRPLFNAALLGLGFTALACGGSALPDAEMAEPRLPRSGVSAPPRPLSVFEGHASYYADFFTGRLTANGERYSPRAFTAAHRRLPFGTVLRVVRLDAPRSVYVRINDRGPYAGRSRVLDLSRAAAEKLDMIRKGVVPVRAEVIEFGRPRRKR